MIWKIIVLLVQEKTQEPEIFGKDFTDDGELHFHNIGNLKKWINC